MRQVHERITVSRVSEPLRQWIEISTSGRPTINCWLSGPQVGSGARNLDVLQHRVDLVRILDGFYGVADALCVQSDSSLECVSVGD
jgi:hypothetical protein